MVVSPIFGPEVSSQVISQITQLSYAIRNVGRISGEYVGLPKSIPDERKGDYLFRDYFFVPIMAAGNEIGIRLAESSYVMPTQIKLLELNRLSKLYGHESIHRPNLPAFFEIKNYTKEMPHFIRDYLLGSTVNGRSYVLTPELLHTKVVPKMMRKNHPSEIHEAKLLAHHLQRIFNPVDYINRFLLKEKRITHSEAQSLKDFKVLIDQAYKVFVDSRQKGDFTELQKFLAPHIKTAELQSNPWLKQWFSSNRQEIQRKTLGPTMKEWLEVIGKKGIGEGRKWLKNQKNIHPDGFMFGLHENLLIPMMERLMPNNPKMTGLLTDLLTNKVRAAQALTAFESSATWFKVPMSIVVSTLLYGIIGSYADVKYVQPLQDLVVKLRGDSTELQAPTYIGSIVGLAAGIGAYKTNFIRRMGHLPSFLISLGIFELGQLGTTYFMFKRTLSKPPNKKGKYRVVHSNNPFHQQQLQASTTPFSTKA